jgi:predicted house-cleaning noncanonical NTP pyrophosphatase (MazG superfamily)
LSKATVGRPFVPLRGLTLVDKEGVHKLASTDVQPSRVGWKAFGLASLPTEWVPRFIVIDANSLTDLGSTGSLTVHLANALGEIGATTPIVMVRSSGTKETLKHRGRLVSDKCARSEILTTIARLMEEQGGNAEGDVHWIVEEYVEPKRQGHLSNERRLSREQRDWVLEVEQQSDRGGYVGSIAVRRWRDGSVVRGGDLECESEPGISLSLKRVAMWATQLDTRLHFEWVWDGTRVRLVQADAAEAAAGLSPYEVLPSEVPDIPPQSLLSFKIATEEHYKRYGKLRNARLYRELGYQMPSFYVLDDPGAIASILQGTLSPEIEHDLGELTKRPLIIRTDGAKIPDGQNEMLPRSDGELRTLEEAKNWVSGTFRLAIEERGLQQAELCLIAHHFIPSVSSAWARAEPGSRMVRIEALWGIPEGLYWYSHDTFEVDTQEAMLSATASGTELQYPYWKRLRFKGTFVASDANGVWVSQQTRPPYDWRRSVELEQWLFEMAHTTRRVAEFEKKPISLMWFVDNHPNATAHRVLPWFHSESELGDTPKAAPRRKVRDARDFKIETLADFTALQASIGEGRSVERVVVEPRDPTMIRGRRFVEDLADFTAEHGIVIELAGGILSHAYYILQNRGCRVECVDLFGADEDVVEYNKLVRDGVPEIIRGRGERVEVVQLAGDALLLALRQKLVEEAFEALDAKLGDDLVGELSDIEEVVRAIGEVLQLRKGRIEAERKDKKKHRGGFSSGFMLSKTATPHSLPKRSTPSAMDFGEVNDTTPKIVISEPADLPSVPNYRRPDRRQVDQESEKLLTFETELNKLTELTEKAKFFIPDANGMLEALSLLVEVTRKRSVLRGVIRLRPERITSADTASDDQLRIEFPDETTV